MQDHTITSAELEAGLRVARKLRVAVFVVACNAEAHIRETLERIPRELVGLLASVFVIDDQSADATVAAARELRPQIPALEVFRTPYFQGYGGNQKLGFRFAQSRDFDLVVLLHGDGRYAPEVLPRLLAPFEDQGLSAVFGSRVLERGATGRGGMPVYKYLGNRLLTAIQNRMLGSNLSEFHSGYRAYRVRDLAELPLDSNTDGYHFDTELTIQLLQRGRRIVEVPIPSYHGDEIGPLNGVAHAFNCLASVAHSRAQRLYLAYHPKFDIEPEGAEYTYKRAPTSLHQYVLARSVKAGERVVELGAGQGDVGAEFARRGAQVVSADLRRPQREFEHTFLELDLDRDFAAPLVEKLGARAELAVALDVLEHLSEPERGLAGVQQLLQPGGTLLASTGNIAYLPLRLALLAGRFNYGKKGILDLTHSRLFTVASFKRLLRRGGFRVVSVRGFGPPIQDMIGDTWYLRALDRTAAFLARVWPGVFGYQFAIEATRLDDVDDLLERTLESARDWVQPAAEARVEAPAAPGRSLSKDAPGTRGESAATPRI